MPADPTTDLPADLPADPSTDARPDLTDRRRDTFEAILDATPGILREHGIDGLTVRAVAAAAGLTHTTAYSFVTSKAQLVAEYYLRAMSRLPAVDLDECSTAAERVTAALDGPATLFAHEPRLAHAVQAALMMGDNTDDDGVVQLRDRIGLITLGRLRTALPTATDELIGLIFVAYNGAMVTAGSGHGSYADVVPTVARLVELLGAQLEVHLEADHDPDHAGE